MVAERVSRRRLGWLLAWQVVVETEAFERLKLPILLLGIGSGRSFAPAFDRRHDLRRRMPAFLETSLAG